MAARDVANVQVGVQFSLFALPFGAFGVYPKSEEATWKVVARKGIDSEILTSR